MKRKSPHTYQSYFPSLWSLKQIRESFSTNGHQKGIEFTVNDRLSVVVLIRERRLFQLRVKH